MNCALGAKEFACKDTHDGTYNGTELRVEE